MSLVSRSVYFAAYSPVGSLSTMAICIVMLILLAFSYVTRNRSLRIFLSIIGLLMVTCLADVTFHMLGQQGNPDFYPLLYGCRLLYHTLLFVIFFLFAVYIGIVTNMNPKLARAFNWIAGVVAVSVILFDTVTTLTGTGFRITPDDRIITGFNIFAIGYGIFAFLLVGMLASVRKLLYKRVMFGFYGAVAVSFIIELWQGLYRQSSFTVVSFLFPVIAMFYIMHSTPYNAALGAVDSRALEGFVRFHAEKKKPFIFLSLYLRDFDEDGKPLPPEIQAAIRQFSSSFFRGAHLFQIGNGHVVLMVRKEKNPDYEHRISKILSAFMEQHKIFQYDYKIVIGESIDEISRGNEYPSFIRSINRHIRDNTVHRVEKDDILRFRRNEYIYHELEDIYSQENMNDPRVLAYCQPVYNTATHRFDTAEALMRLQLSELGIVPPEDFIHIAEEHGFIHMLTKIILHKTCDQVRQLIDEGYEINRISVNVSVLEMKDDAFCEDINHVISDSRIPGEKIAIELTESQSDNDFRLMKEKIQELRQQGLKFYLDDFGTGYSNMERIMELPFDIIKFDRSMVVASGSSQRSEKIVENLANMFSEMEYSVLYEGVEDEMEEKRCLDMSASYLQGFRYSRPIPIQNLKAFLKKESA